MGSDMFYRIIRPLLFALSPEYSHDLTLQILKALHTFKAFDIIKTKPFSYEVKYFGLTFPNPIGLAAGLDKDGECIPVWKALGFGFIEVGTVTPKPQSGNVKPRLFRLEKDAALINRMGFNNKGIDNLIARLKGINIDCPIGVNIGKNRDTPLEMATEDYLHSYQKVYPYADYVTVNLSSPNTPGLKNLQHGEQLKKIIIPLKQAQYHLTEQYNKKVPILVKISPDLSTTELHSVVDNLVSLEVEGIIATNTTIRRDPALHSRHSKEEGGL